MVLLGLYSLVTVGYLFLFCLSGTVLPKKYLSGSLSMTCIYGFLLYFAVFQIIAFPMKYLGLSLKTLSYTWAVVLCLLVLFALLYRREYLWECAKGIIKAPLSTKILWLLLVVITLAIAYVLGSNINPLSDMDAAYAIGTPVSSVYSNTLERMSPYTGNMRDAAEDFYILCTDMVHSAVMSQLIKIKVLAERRWTFTIAMLILFELGIYQLSKHLCDDDKEKQGVFWILANLVLFFSFSYSGVAAYLSYRTYEGKAILCYFYTMVMLLLCLMIYCEKNSFIAWSGLLCCSVGAVAFTNSALFIVPMMTGMTLSLKLVRDTIHRKNISCWINLAIVLAPSLLWMAIYKLI